MDDQFDGSPTSRNAIADKVQATYKANEQYLKVDFQLQPLSDIHLRSNFLADVAGHGNVQNVYIFIIVATFILVVACINFMNLATARAARRAKEVGLRKVAGAVRSHLVRQFLVESIGVAFVSMLLAVLTVLIVLPYFNDLAGKNLGVSFNDMQLMGGLLAVTVVTGLVAGSYPALFLSGFVPASVLKGSLSTGSSNSMFRNVMVVIQFTVSIALIVGTSIVYQQLEFIRDRNLGYDKENLLYVQMTGDLWSKYDVLKARLAHDPLTANYAFTGDLPTDVTNATVGVKWEGKDPDAQPLFFNLAVDENFIDVFNMTLLAGRGFSKDFRADTVNMVVNETALKTMGMSLDSAVGQPLMMWGKKGTIIGVVKDFNYKPIKQAIEPMILRLNTWGGYAIVRTRPGETARTIQILEAICKELNPGYPFNYNFVDEELAKLYRSEQRLGSLFNVFAALAIIISCLGLYGLSAYLAERRTREIGIRKVLGATGFQLVYLLSVTFTRPILVAMLIASPLAWYAMNSWLTGFAYHIDISWTVFVVAFVIAIGIALLTVSYESIKAAGANPATSLRSE